MSDWNDDDQDYAMDRLSQVNNPYAGVAMNALAEQYERNRQEAEKKREQSDAIKGVLFIVFAFCFIGLIIWRIVERYV